MSNTERIVVQVVVKGQKDLANLEKRTGTTTKSLGAMTAGIVTATAAFNRIQKAITGAIRTFTKFEFEMAKVKAITGSTEKDFKKLTNTAQQLGRSTFFTASQVAELQVNFGKLGFSTAEILEAQEATLMLATATQSDLGRAAVVAGAAVRGFGLDAQETQRVVDVMAVAFTSSALDIEKFQTSMTKVAPIAAAASISIESTSAVMGTLTDAGIEASIAGTSLRNIFLKMQDPASDLSKHLGFTVESSADLEKALKQLNDEGLSNAEMMELVDLRQVAAFQTMVNGADRVLDLTDALEDANGKAQEMADIMADTLQGDILKAKSAWEGLEIAFMTGSINMSRAVRIIVQDFTNFISTVVGNMQTPEQLGADFLTESLNRIKDTQKEIDDLQKSGAPVDSKSRVELLELEIQKLETVQNAQKAGLETQKELADGFGPIAIAARQVVKDTENQIKAREFALGDLREILDQEVKAEKQKNDRIELEADIARLKGDRARKKEEDEKLKEQQEADRKSFEVKRTQLQTFHTDEMSDLTQQLIDKQITQQEFDQMAFDAEQTHLMQMMGLYAEYGKSTADINNQMLNSELKRIQTVAEEEKRTRQEQIESVNNLGEQLIFLAGEDKKLQGIRKAGVALSAAAAIANNIEALSLATKAVAAQGTQPFPKNIVGMVTTLSTIVSLFANLKAMKETFGNGGVVETFANGGMVHGRSHAQGGEKFAVGGRVVELEGGEAVINKRSTAMFRNQLSAMNAAGGGVKFADGGLLNMPSFSQQEFNALNQNQMMGAMSSSSGVVVVEADITESQNTVNVIQAQATI